ncbi:FaeA/PapI family transcriptional regulator, partial [Salmonella enterica subsp. enterica serovar Lubbock]|nr:FaeA/PapI family transcriptional regulator [Salmonella enterica subsp. enterica serovar Lubbock]
SIADAAGLTIYQARAYLVTLEDAGVVEKMNAGKGVSGRWRLVSSSISVIQLKS